jgi:hypothetical protein
LVLASIPAHIHTRADETVFVVSGDFIEETVEYGPGSLLPHLLECHMVRIGVAEVALCSLLFRHHWTFKSFSNDRAEPEMVVPAGYAPASSGYQLGALLLSYRTEIGSSGAPW